MKRLFGTQGIRGIVNETITPDLVYDIGLALAKHLGYQSTVGVGWDTRISSEMLAFAISTGIMAGGGNVYLLGLAPTPLLSFAIPRLELNGGVMITASHNPPEFNGIKLWGADGAAFTDEMEQELEAIYFLEKGVSAPWKKCGYLVPTEDFQSRYIERLVNQVNSKRIMKQKPRVVADCGGGAASVIVPTLFQVLKLESELLYCSPDGLFKNRLPEPKEKHLSELIKFVKQNDVDIGMAWDGDADRVVLITNEGRYLMGDRTFALAAYHHMKNSTESQKTIVTQVATSDVIRDVAQEVGAKIVETRVGEPHIAAMMKKTNAQIGGEENGGVIYQGWSWTREGLLTALLILDIITQEEESLEKLDQRFPSYAQMKKSIACVNEQKFQLLKRIAMIVPSDAECQTLDGLKLRYSDGWLLLRPSGTEPIFRIFAEAKTQSRAKTLVKLGLKLAKDAYAEITKQ